jgi:ABC-type antimicrobial peptide transport system permease subunit
VNESFAKRYFPRGEAVGRRILVQATDQEPAEIVGVVGDTRQERLTSDPTPLVYLLHAQTPGYITNLVVRTTGDAVAPVAAIRRAVQEVDPTMALAGIETMEQYVGAELARPRLYATLVASFALMATMLAAIGIYGLIAFVVRQRRREIGIRLALGATRERVFAEVLRQGARLIAIGFVLGVVAAAGFRGLVSRFLFGVAPDDAVTYLMAATAILGLGLAAVMIPAHRASRVEPIDALRCE